MRQMCIKNCYLLNFETFYFNYYIIDYYVKTTYGAVEMVEMKSLFKQHCYFYHDGGIRSYTTH